MDSSSSGMVSLDLLPSDVLYDIFSRLSATDVLRLRSTGKLLLSLLSSPPFTHLLSPHRHRPWLFLLHRLPPRHTLLLGFTPLSSHWFRYPIARLLPFPDLYLLAAAGDTFLLASNSRRELLSLNVRTASVLNIPPSPLGPRDTSTWRRSALKLLPDGPLASGHFRFLFVELHHHRPHLLCYTSRSNTWGSRELPMNSITTLHPDRKDRIFLTIGNVGNESLVVTSPDAGYAAVCRPIWTEPGDGLRVFGDGNMAVVRWREGEVRGTRVVVGVELWEVSGDGGEWVKVGRAPKDVVDGAAKGRTYGAAMGCVEEERESGVVTVVLVFNNRGAWGVMWVFYDKRVKRWGWVPVVETGGRRFNMAGIALSSSSTIALCSSV